MTDTAGPREAAVQALSEALGAVAKGARYNGYFTLSLDEIVAVIEAKGWVLATEPSAGLDVVKVGDILAHYAGAIANGDTFAAAKAIVEYARLASSAVETTATPEPSAQENREAATTRLYMTPEDIEAALGRLRGPVTHDEATVMAAAQAAADALRGARIILATEPSAGVTSEAADRYPPYPAAPVLGGLPDSSPLSGAGSGDIADGGLRKALELAIGLAHDLGVHHEGHPATWYGVCPNIVCRVATSALAATTPSVSDEGLDEYRLALAIGAAWPKDGLLSLPVPGPSDAFTDAIATEYRALLQDDKEAGGAE